MSTLKDMIFDLSEANGTPGEEGEISNIIEKYVSKFAEVKKDKFGNVTADMIHFDRTLSFRFDQLFTNHQATRPLHIIVCQRYFRLS